MKKNPYVTNPNYALCEPIIETYIDDDYCVELGTYLPMKKRIEDMKQAGIDLQAYREAYSLFYNGTGNLDLDNIEMSELTDDEIDIFNKKLRHLEAFKEQQEIQKRARKELENTIQEKAKKFDEMQQKQSESENSNPN